MRKGYEGLSTGNRIGCFAAVLATPAIFFVLFVSFMPDFEMPNGSLLLEVVLPALAAGGALFLIIRAIVAHIRPHEP